ncbi:15535_t:CDS:1, partial [Gigaspora rosea]
VTLGFLSCCSSIEAQQRSSRNLGGFCRNTWTAVFLLAPANCKNW